MASTGQSFETGHADMVHDAQLDYYGKRLATCSSDRVIKIFDVIAEGQQVHVADLTGHDGPVWTVCWAHPKFGGLLASCSFDRKVIIWKETQENVWTQLYVSSMHDSSVNCVAWAPHEVGLMLACASSDGTISILTHQADSSWSGFKVENAHSIGCTGVSWAPATPAGALVGAASVGKPVKRVVSGGCDNLVKVWGLEETTGTWKEEAVLTGHTDWVRDVAWAPNMGMPVNTIASASQDGKVTIWSQQDQNGEWAQVVLNDFGCPVWRVSWSITGNILAVSDGNNEVTLWKEALDGQWHQVSSVQ